MLSLRSIANQLTSEDAEGAGHSCQDAEVEGIPHREAKCQPDKEDASQGSHHRVPVDILCIGTLELQQTG